MVYYILVGFDKLLLTRSANLSHKIGLLIEKAWHEHSNSDTTLVAIQSLLLGTENSIGRDRFHRFLYRIVSRPLPVAVD